MSEINKEEFASLIHENQLLMYRFALGILKSEMDAEDAVSEAVIKAWEHLDKLRKKEKFKSWIMTILANETKNILTKKKKVELMESLDNFGKAACTDGTELWELVMELPEDFRMVVILYYYEGFSTKEIAKILKISGGTVKSRLSRARQKLKVLLEEI